MFTWLFDNLNCFGIIIALLAITFIRNYKFILRCIQTIPRDYVIVRYLYSIRFRFFFVRLRKESVHDLFKKTVDRIGAKRIACVCEDIEWSFGDLKAYSDRIALVYKSLGIQTGDKIALFSENTAFYSQIWLGANKIGASTGLINYSLKNESLSHCLNEIAPKLIVASSDMAMELAQIKSQVTVLIFDSEINTNDIEKRIAMGQKDARPKVDEILNKNPGWLSLDKLMSNVVVKEYVVPKRKLSEPCLYIFTSGTTGMPKAAVVTQERFIMASFGPYYLLNITSDDVIYTTMPLYHTAGGILGVGQCLMNGTKQVIRKKFSASNFWTDCVKYECTVVQYIGEICRYLLAQPQRAEETQHKVHTAFGNGMRRQIWTEFVERFHIKNIRELYGATESSANTINVDNKVGSIGFGSIIIPWAYPLVLVECDLTTGELKRDIETGFCKVVGYNQPGQLISLANAKSGLTFTGYMNREATEKKIARNVFKKGDAWFLTGDLLEQDNYGYFYFKDRLGDTFRWKGENVSTNEVEGFIAKSIDLIDCCVYGVAIPNCEGKAGMAAIYVDSADKTEIELQAYYISLAKAIKSYLNTTLPAYAHPIFIRFVRSIEMTSTYKSKKFNLIKDGYNPGASPTETFLYYNSNKKQYEKINEEIYSLIESSKIKF